MLLSVALSGGKKMLVAHRGASAYAPEHTLAAYELAIEQGADYVEQDLQITSDGVLVCLHDPVLERTTNVEEVFPDRFRGRSLLTEASGGFGWSTILPSLKSNSSMPVPGLGQHLQGRPFRLSEKQSR